MNKVYPKDYADSELIDKINEYADVPVNSPDNVSYFTKASIGLIELQGRQNNKIALWTLLVAGLALVISFLQFLSNCQI